MEHVESLPPSNYKALQSLIYGSIIHSVMQVELMPDPQQHFKKTSVYLDTNVLVDLLGLDYEENSRPTIELYKLMLDAGHFEFFVFDATVGLIPYKRLLTHGRIATPHDH